MIKRILIANRGEIACRVMRTAKAMGIDCIAVYSEADENSLHVTLADVAYCLGAPESRESYLNIEKIIATAKLAKADAIHPGYGFLSENAGFAKACEDAGIIFIGPSSKVISLMGSKSAAKQLMVEHNIPTVPGYHEDDQNTAKLQTAADKIGYPILLKAAAGGGGKGMRIVWKKEEFNDALSAAKREAKASFNDDKILIEKYLTNPRHIEMQIFADHHGNVVHLFERDCSIQRRYQKVIEESPAHSLSDKLRQDLAAAAVKIGQVIGYANAGTIEFLVNDEEFYFMEMNTRLQVEHAVTEMITGLDLVAWQIHVANNEPLPLSQTQIKQQGHAIEVRLCAEDPTNNFLPSSGKIHYLKLPPENSHTRIDYGIRQNDTVSIYYDSMLAKIIVIGKTREQAILQLQHALSKTIIVGVKTNRQLLLNIASHPEFLAKNTSTNFIAKWQNDLMPAHHSDITSSLAIAGLYLLHQQTTLANTNDKFSPWHLKNAWQANLTTDCTFKFQHQNDIIDVVINLDNNSYTIKVNEQIVTAAIIKLKQHEMQLIIDQQQLNATIIKVNNDIHVYYANHAVQLTLADTFINNELDSHSQGRLIAPMPGTVIAMNAKVNDKVKKGDVLLIIEAMKMEHSIFAGHDGIVKEIYYQKGDKVNEGNELLLVETAD